jgi:hypothetical protein
MLIFMGKHSRYTSQYLLRLEPEAKQRLASKADEAGVPLADAFRLGAEQYLDGQIARKTGTEEPDPIVTQMRSLGALIERRLGD